MKFTKGLAISVLAVASIGVAAIWFAPVGQASTAPFDSLAGDIARGVYLARASGCIACHTDVKNGGQPLAGGPPLVSGFGTFVAPNLTTDLEEGIGGWTLEQFDVAVRQGVAPDGSPYYPAFPFAFYAKLSDQDIVDLWAAFQTVPAVNQPAPEHGLNFPFNQRQGLKFWRVAFLELAEFTPDIGKSEAWNRGKFLVTGPAHCGACHTPRNIFGARQSNQYLAGADGLPGEDKAPAITAAALLEAGWKSDDLAYALKSGILPDGDVFGGTMAEAVRDGLAFLTPEDRQAIVTYLMDE